MTVEEDDFQRSLDYIVEGAEELLDRPYTRGGGRESQDLCEVMETMEEVVIIADLTKARFGQLSVSVTEEEMRIRGPGMEVAQRLPCRVDPSTLRSDSRNGIVTMTVAKPALGDVL